MRTLKDLERQAYIKGDTTMAALYGQLIDAEHDSCDCEESYQLHSDSDYEELEEDFAELQFKYEKVVKEFNALKHRMEGLEK